MRARKSRSFKGKDRPVFEQRRALEIARQEQQIAVQNKSREESQAKADADKQRAIAEKARQEKLALIFLPGVIAAHVRTHAWLAFAINLYFIQGVLICFQPGRLEYGLLMSGFSVLYFVAALYFIRWSFQAQRVERGET